MSLTEFLVANIGSSVAKAIFKLWVKDPGLAQDAGMGIIDFLKSKVSDGMASKRGSRQFEEIAEQVAETLVPVFEHEKLNASDKERISQAVGKAIGRLKISPALLAKKNLEPTELSRFIRNANAAERKSLFDLECAFYDRLIDQCSQYIVDIASQLPSFTEKTFAEVLQRQDELRNIAAVILKKIEELQQKSQEANPKKDFAQFEADYRLAVMRKLDQVELFGIDVSAPSRRYRLSVAYISLTASGAAPRPKAVDTPSGLAKKHRDQQPEQAKEEERITQSVEGVLANAERLLIRGLAGSGKTTLLKWIAVQCSARKLQNDLADWNNKVPFVIFLRQCAESGLPAPQNFVQHLVPLIADKMPPGWVHECLESGRAIVMVDGVDEVPQIQRETVHRWIKELGELFTRIKIIVTSRPVVEEGWLWRESFAEFDLEPMDLANIDKFLKHWHDAVREELQFEPENAAKLDDLESSLRDMLRQNRAVRSLATNPLLCSTICALHRDRNKQIPIERIRLYEACCEMLLERRGKEQELIVDKQFALLSYGQKLKLLQDLAYYMIRNELSVISVEDADERFKQKMVNFGDKAAEYDVADLRKFLVERSGLLRVPVETQIDFVHRTFQEFLGAKAAVDENDLGLLLRNAKNDQWREVIVLAAGHAPPKISKKLIAKLLEKGDADKANRHQLHFLALACLETAIEVDAELRQQVNKRVAKLIPPKNLNEAKAIALTGDLALPLLAYNDKLTAKEAVASVYALKSIRNDDNAALKILKSYKNESRQSVIREIAKDAVDDEALRREVLTELENLFTYVPVRNFMRLENLRQLSDFPQIKRTSHLDLSECSLLNDLNGLPPRLPELTTLNLSGCVGLSDLGGLPTMPKLRSLDLRRCAGLKDLKGLPKLLKNAGVKPIRLRDTLNDALSESAVKSILQAKNFFDSSWNTAGKGLSHFYVVYGAQKESVVMDYATGLMWQQNGSEDTMTWSAAREYVEKLNRDKFAGHTDWRLPTLEEGMSLMEPKKINADIYIDPIFDKRQSWIWTVDKETASAAWVVLFRFGNCYLDDVGDGVYVRAVRSGQ